MSEPYELTIEDRENYLYACITAPMIDLQIAVAYSNELMAHLRQTHQTKVLFIRETPEMVSQSHYAMVASIIANMLPAHIKFAVVDHSPSHALVKACILEERANKHRNINAFDTLDEAEAWLLNEKS